MKKKLFTIMFFAAGIMISACNSQKNNGNAADNQEDEIVTDTDDPTGIATIRQSWAEIEIDVDAGDITPGIEQFALAFCEQYPQCETNKALMDYILSSDEFDGDLYDVTCDPGNGYIRCMMLAQTAPFTCVCYWSRNDGHKLVVASMENTHESGAWDEDLAVFYDYDPYTDTMTPESSLTNMIEDRMEAYDTYTVELPQEGVDITVYGYTIDEENDSAETDTMVLSWNGQDFEWEN